jgi:hypothetical protein
MLRRGHRCPFQPRWTRMGSVIKAGRASSAAHVPGVPRIVRVVPLQGKTSRVWPSSLGVAHKRGEPRRTQAAHEAAADWEVGDTADLEVDLEVCVTRRAALVARLSCGARSSRVGHVWVR